MPTGMYCPQGHAQGLNVLGMDHHATGGSCLSVFGHCTYKGSVKEFFPDGLFGTDPNRNFFSPKECGDILNGKATCHLPKMRSLVDGPDTRLGNFEGSVSRELTGVRSGISL
jgi:hypothetical protein